MNQIRVLQYAKKGIIDIIDELNKQKKLNPLINGKEINKEIEFLNQELDEINFKLLLEGVINE
nr:MAG TPA: hypothetical protein [Caudoviricetes sp.]